jgi:SpoVK/Ycf46/Vps4 family AAA+-type ATPase
MEIRRINKEKIMKIDEDKREVYIAYIAKIKVVIQNKELEIVEKLWKILPLRYDSDKSVENLELIEHTMNDFENQMNEIIEKIKKTFADLEQILEKYQYSLI